MTNENLFIKTYSFYEFEKKITTYIVHIIVNCDIIWSTKKRGFVSSWNFFFLLLPNAPLPPPLPTSPNNDLTRAIFLKRRVCRKLDMLDGESVTWHDSISARKKKKKETTPSVDDSCFATFEPDRRILPVRANAR